MSIPFVGLQTQVSENHRRVISVRMRLLEESCFRLLDQFRDVDSTLAAKKALPREKAGEIERLTLELRSEVSRMKSELCLERPQFDASREAGALLAAMTINLEELRPRYLNGYGIVPEALALYLEIQINGLLRILQEIRQALERPLSGAVPEG
jgi:hypothetical protein